MNILIFVIGVYIVLFISLFIVFLLIKNHLIKILKEFEEILDELFYVISLKLYEKQGKISKLEEFLDVFQVNKKEFFSKERKSFVDFYNFWQSYKNDINYFSEMINENVVDITLIDHIDKLAEGLFIIGKYYNFVKNVLCYMSLRLFCR